MKKFLAIILGLAISGGAVAVSVGWMDILIGG